MNRCARSAGSRGSRGLRRLAHPVGAGRVSWRTPRGRCGRTGRPLGACGQGKRPRRRDGSLRGCTRAGTAQTLISAHRRGANGPARAVPVASTRRRRRPALQAGLVPGCDVPSLLSRPLGTRTVPLAVRHVPRRAVPLARPPRAMAHPLGTGTAPGSPEPSPRSTLPGVCQDVPSRWHVWTAGTVPTVQRTCRPWCHVPVSMHAHVTNVPSPCHSPPVTPSPCHTRPLV